MRRAQSVEPQHFNNSASASSGESAFKRSRPSFNFAPADCPVNSQATDAAVRVDVEAHVRDRARLCKLFFVEVARVRLQLRARQNFPPRQRRNSAFVSQLLSFGVAHFQRAGVRVVAFEVRRVNFDSSNHAPRRQLE